MEYASASLIAGSSIARVRWARSLTVAARSSNPSSSRCLDEGRWQGRQLVSAELVKEATIDQLTKEQRSDGFQQPWADGPYWYFWWVGDTESHHYFGAVGLYGQNIHVVPDSRLILVTVSDERGFPAPTEEFYAIAGRCHR
jgi:CubicO group peptidase (beta-lactamase class C family)